GSSSEHWTRPPTCASTSPTCDRGRGGAALEGWRASCACTQQGRHARASSLEERMLALCRRFELPAPEVNVDVMGYEVDFVWRVARVIVETDGWEAHGTRAACERDR